MPLPQTARQIVKSLRFGEGALPLAVARALESVCGVKVAPSDFDEQRLPEHLRLRIEVVGANDDTIATGRE